MAIFGLLLYIMTQQWVEEDRRELTSAMIAAGTAEAKQMAAVAKTDAKLATTELARLREDLRVAGIKLSDH